MFGNLFNKAKSFLPLGLGLTAVFFTVYMAVQQNFRLSANDPQVQIAQDLANTLVSGTAADNILPPYKFDISNSLSTFVILFNDKYEVVAGTAELDGQTPIPPGGVFETAKKAGQNRFTWEPKDGARNAVVVSYYETDKPGYVLVGRSLKEVESRDMDLRLIISVSWGITMLVTFIAHLLVTSTGLKVPSLKISKLVKKSSKKK